jgi:hypothetical protein
MFLFPKTSSLRVPVLWIRRGGTVRRAKSMPLRPSFQVLHVRICSRVVQ